MEETPPSTATPAEAPREQTQPVQEQPPTGLEQIPTPDLLKLKEELEEREWDAAYINSLPDSAFAWIDPAYGKTSDNKNLRKLPHHDRDGKVDRTHLIAAMQALLGARGGVDIPATARREVYNHLARHYRELDMEPPEFHEAKVEERKEVKEMAKEEAGKGIVAEPTLVEAIGPWQVKVANKLKEALTTTDAAKAIPTIWSPQVELGAQPKRVMRALGIVDTTLRGAPGNKFYFPKVPTVLTAVGATEGQAPSELSVTVDRLEITTGEIIAALAVTRQVVEQVTFNVVDVLTDLLSEAVANKEDADILDALDSATGIAATLYGGDATSEGEVAEGDVLTTDLIADGVTAMRKEKREPRYLVIHPAQENALLKSDQFINAAQYGGREVILNGEIGQWLGIKVLKTTQIPTGTGSGGITTYHAFLLSDRVWVEEVKRDPEVETKYEPGERKTYLYGTMEYGLGVLNPKGIVKIITA